MTTRVPKEARTVRPTLARPRCNVYIPLMSELLDHAIAQVRTLPAEAQEEAARLLLEWANDMPPATDERPPELLDPAHKAAVAEGLADVRAGRIASTDDVEKAFALFRSNQ